jgi:hypothetical protein
MTDWRHLTLVLAVAATIAGAAYASPIAQPPEYNLFVDQRPLLGVANGFDVLSNLAFAVVGVAGLAVTVGRRPGMFAHPWDQRPYAVLFLGVTLASVGSTYFHLAPDNARLLWDRLPMAVGFMALLVALLAERVHRRLARALFLPLLAAGAASVVYWHWSELQGMGDLRPYLVVQFGSLAIVALILMLYRGTGTGYLVAGLATYAAAKALELADAPIFAVTGHVISGHTLKHLVAAGGVACIVVMLQRRQALRRI